MHVQQSAMRAKASNIVPQVGARSGLELSRRANRCKATLATVVCQAVQLLSIAPAGSCMISAVAANNTKAQHVASLASSVSSMVRTTHSASKTPHPHTHAHKSMSSAVAPTGKALNAVPRA